MSEGYNKVTLFGNLGADPELKRLPSGASLLRMRLATSQSWVNREGVREERTEWHSVVLWGNRAEGLARILRKGSYLLVEGQIRSHSYEKDGDKRYYTEIHADNVFLGGRRRTSEVAYGDAERLPDSRFDPDLRPDADPREGTEPRPEVDPRTGAEVSEPASPEPKTPFDPRPDFEPAGPKPSRGGEGGGEAPPAAPGRKKTRSPAPAPAMAA